MASQEFSGFIINEPKDDIKKDSEFSNFTIDEPVSNIQKTDEFSGFVIDEPIPPQGEIITPEQQQQKEIITDKLKGDGFWKRLFDSTGKALSQQARIGEVRTPEQAKAVTDFAKEIASEATFSLSELIPGFETPEESDTRVTAMIAGSLLPIVGFDNYVLKPLTKIIKGAGPAGKHIIPFARLAGWETYQATKKSIGKAITAGIVRATGWGLFGSTKKATESLVEKGELPTSKELIKEGAIWAIMDGILQAGGVAVEFGVAINKLAEDAGISNKEMLGEFFKAVKNKGFDMYTKTPTAEEALEIAREYARNTKGKVPLDITTVETSPPEIVPEVEPIKPPVKEPVKPVVKPVEKITVKSPEVVKPKVEPVKVPVKEKLNSLNPTGTVFTEYTPNKRAELELGKDLTTLDKTMGRKPDEKIKIYRGATFIQKEIVPGDFITTNKQLARDYAGTGNVLEKEVALSDILDDITAPLGEEYIYRPKKVVKPLAKKTIPQPTEGKRLRPDVEGKGESPKRSDIIKMFHEKFKTPLRTGKFRQRAAGIFKPDYKVIRLKNANDIETASHEVGHDLSYKLWKTAKGIEANLMPYMDELKPISRYAPHAEEGIAEFTRMYVTRPDSAKELAPKFYKFFEKTLDGIAPELKETLLDAREAYSKYLNASAEGRVEAQIESRRFYSVAKRAKDWLDKNFSIYKLKTDWLDDLYPIKQAVADAMGIRPVEVEAWKSPLNIYRSARLLKGWIGKADVFLHHETFDLKTLKPVGKSLQEILSPIKNNLDMKRFDNYLVARRVIEKSKQGFKTGISREDAIIVVSKGAKEFEPIAKELNKYQDDLLKYVRDSGLISQDSYLKMKKMNKLYTPFARVMDEEARDFFGRLKVKSKVSQASGAGRLQSSQPVKRFKGSTRDIISPIETTIANTYFFIKMSERNLVGRQLSGLARISKNSIGVDKIPPSMAITKANKEEILAAIKKNLTSLIPHEMLDDLIDLLPETLNIFRPSAWSPKENVITVWVKGKAQYYEVPSDLAKAWKGGIDRYSGGVLTKLLSAPAKLLRAGAILNPRFLKKNIARDTIERIVFTKDSAKNISKNIMEPIAGLFSAIKRDKLYIDFLKAGGGMATMQSIDKVVAVNRLSATARGFEKVRPIKILRHLGELSEEANRLAEFASVLKGEPDNRLTKEMAAYAARDISIDFAKIGMLAKSLNKIIPFWNATIQGGDKLVRTMASGDPETIRNFLFRAILGISLPTLLIKAAMRGDKDIEEIDDITKDSNWILKSPLSGKMYQYPVPFETGILFHGTMARSFDFIVENDKDAFDGFFGSIVNGILPEYLPAFAKPPLEVYANKDFWRLKPVVPPAKVGLISEEQYSVYTTETSKMIARTMKYMPGVNEYESQLTSPAIVEHYITSWGAGLGRLLLKLSDEGLKLAGVEPEFIKPEQGFAERLGLNAFERRAPNAGAKSITEFYDNYNLYKKIERSAKAKAEKGDKEGYNKLRRDFGVIKIDAIYKTVQKQQQAINNIMRNPNIKPKEKRDLIDKLYFNMIIYTRNANKQIEKYHKKIQD